MYRFSIGFIICTAGPMGATLLARMGTPVEELVSYGGACRRCPYSLHVQQYSFMFPPGGVPKHGPLCLEIRGCYLRTRSYTAMVCSDGSKRNRDGSAHDINDLISSEPEEVLVPFYPGPLDALRCRRLLANMPTPHRLCPPCEGCSRPERFPMALGTRSVDPHSVCLQVFVAFRPSRYRNPSPRLKRHDV